MKNGIAYKKLLLIGDSKVGKTCFIKKNAIRQFHCRILKNRK